MVERQPHEGVARLQERHVNGVVVLGAGVRLDVGVLGPEELLRPVHRELLGNVDPLAAAVVALARVALGVPVDQDRTHRLEDRPRDELFACDHLQHVPLTMWFPPEHPVHLRVHLGERRELLSMLAVPRKPLANLFAA